MKFLLSILTLVVLSGCETNPVSSNNKEDKDKITQINGMIYKAETFSAWSQSKALKDGASMASNFCQERGQESIVFDSRSSLGFWKDSAQTTFACIDYFDNSKKANTIRMKASEYNKKQAVNSINNARVAQEKAAQDLLERSVVAQEKAANKIVPNFGYGSLDLQNLDFDCKISGSNRIKCRPD